MTKHDVMTKYPFYSVDSTSWLSGVMYGTIPIFNKTRITTIPIGKRRNISRVLQHMKHIDFNRLYSDDSTISNNYIRELGIIAFQSASKYYHKLWKKRNIKWVS